MGKLRHKTDVAAVFYSPNDDDSVLTWFNPDVENWELPQTEVIGDETPLESLKRYLSVSIGIIPLEVERISLKNRLTKPLSGETFLQRSYVFHIKSWKGEITNLKDGEFKYLGFKQLQEYVEKKNICKHLDWLLNKHKEILTVSVENRKLLKYKPVESSEHPGWYKVPGYPYFLANKEGYVKNAKTGYKTKGSLDDRGYRRCCIWDNKTKRKKEVKVHRVICTAFHGPCPSDKHEVGHKNDKRSDNRSANLEWTTRKKNMAKVFRRVSMESYAVGYGYFALTKDEIYQDLITYKKSKSFTHKAIHKNLNALTQFIEDNFGTLEDWFYVKVDLHGLIIDEETTDDVCWSVKLPFKLSLKDKDIYPMSTPVELSTGNRKRVKLLNPTQPLSLLW